MLSKITQIDFKALKWFNHIAGKYEWLDIIIIFCSDYLIWLIAICLVGYLIYKFLKNKKNVKWSPVLWIFLITALGWGINQIIGAWHFRARPFRSHYFDVYQLTKFLASVNDKSFPSDHTVIAFSLAFSTFLFINKKLGVIFLLAAILIGLGRVMAGIHYPLDVIAGILVAILSVLIIWIIKQIIVYAHPQRATSKTK